MCGEQAGRDQWRINLEMREGATTRRLVRVRISEIRMYDRQRGERKVGGKNIHAHFVSVCKALLVCAQATACLHVVRAHATGFTLALPRDAHFQMCMEKGPK